MGHVVFSNVCISTSRSLSNIHMIPEINDDFLKVRYTPDRWKPRIKHRRLQMVRTGTWFFGLLGTYKLVYTDWIEE